MNTLRFDYEPHAKQQQIHYSCSSACTNTWTVVVAGRQGGKSKCAKFQAIAWAMGVNDSVVWYVTPSEGQAKVVFREIYLECSKMGLVKSKIQSKGDINITFINGSKIEFKSAGSEDTLRGSSVHYLILDECAFIKKSTIEDIILPTMNVTGRKILAVSTPKGKNFLFELYMRALSDNEDFQKDYKSFKFTSSDNPAAKPALLRQFKQSLPEAVYAQEFEAEFVDQASVFSNVRNQAVLRPITAPRKGERYYMAADIALAAKGDYTVITILNNRGELCYMDRFRGLEAPELRQRIVSAYKTFMPVQTTIESNNQGLPIIQDLQKQIPNLEPFYTTSDTKAEIINKLIAAFSLKEIYILDDNTIIDELNAFIFRFSPTGKITFEAASGFHDDIVMSLAICWHSYSSAVKTGGYNIRGAEDVHKAPVGANRKTGLLDHLENNNLGKFNGEDGEEFIFFS